jgi:glycosyltransferase involved in cell wall biosynthesis
MNVPILSIVIPTRNRYSYLKSCLLSLHLIYNNPSVEIIITDNSSPRENIDSLLNTFSNIKYTYIDKPISQVENFEFALNMVSGKYVTMIGDDDGLSGVLLDVVRYMENKSIDALNAPFATYYWPDVISKSKSNKFSGKIYFENYSYSILKVNASTEIKNCLNVGATSLCNLPRMYYGIIRKDVINQVKALTGQYFPGPSPDMANAFSSALFVSKFVYFDAPLFIAGNSAKSAAGMGLAGKHVSEIEGNPQLPKNCHLQWSSFVPKYWSGPTIWAETAVQVMHKTKRKDLEDQMNYLRLFASCLIFNSEYQTRTKDSIKKYMVGKTLLTKFKLLLEKINVWFLRLKFLIKNVINNYVGFNKSKVIEDVPNINEASFLLKYYEAEIMNILLDEQK